jgi:hypothetical protein
MDDVTSNWRGWLASFLFHAGLAILAACITWKVIEEQQDVLIETDLVAANEALDTNPLEDLFDDSPVDSEVDAPPSVDAEVMRPNIGYNELTPGVPDWITSGGHLTGRIGEGGGGGDHLAGKSWGGYLRGIQKSGLDVVFVFDSTGSMGGIILEVKTRIRQLMKVVAYLVPNARLGLVTYRDRKMYDLDSYEYTVKWIPLTNAKDGLDKLQEFLRETEALGGGDIPEAVYEGLEAAMSKAGWNPAAKKVIIVFGDAPPRSEENGLARVYDLCKKWHAASDNNVISCIDTTGGSRLLEEFKQIAVEGGGESCFLNDDRAIIKQLVVFIFGSKWETEVDKVYKDVLPEQVDTMEEVK